MSDDLGLIEMLTDNIDYFKSKPVNMTKIKILLDHGSHPRKLQEALEEIYPGIIRKIRFQLSAKPSKVKKKAQGKYTYDFGDSAHLTPLTKMHTLGNSFVPEGFTLVVYAITVWHLY